MGVALGGRAVPGRQKFATIASFLRHTDRHDEPYRAGVRRRRRGLLEPSLIRAWSARFGRVTWLNGPVPLVLSRVRERRLEFPILLLHPGLRHRCVAPDRRHAVRQRRMAMPLRWKTSGLLGSRRAHAATNRQSAAHRPFIGRLLAVKAHASALRTSRSRDNRPIIDQ